jgi:hypothetical protein
MPIFPGLGPAKLRADYYPSQERSARSLPRFCTAISLHGLPGPLEAARLPRAPLSGSQLHSP